MNFMRRHILLALLALLLLSCGQSYSEKQRLSKEQRDQQRREDSLSLKVAVLPTLDCLPLYVAADRHIFDTLGVDVHLKGFNAQIDCDEAFRKGMLEGMVSDLIRAERFHQQGFSLRYVASTNAYWLLISNRLARIKERSQLGDKMVACTRFSITDYLTDAALKGVKTKADVFKVQINDVNLRLQMLRNNEMDALWLPEPQATQAQREHHPVLFDSRKLDFRAGVVVFNAAKLTDARRQQQLRLFLKAYDRACDSINLHGYGPYADLIQRYCKVDGNTIKALPKLKFEHALPPRQKDIDLAKKQ